MTDIQVDFDTEREHALHLSLYLHSNDAIMFAEPPEWRFIAGNPAALKMFTIKEEANFVTMEPWKLSPERQPDGRLSSEKAREMISIAMRDGAHFFEWTHRRINGEDFPATVLLVKVELEGATILQATVKDITRDKQAAQKLAELEEKHRSIVENSSEYIFIVNNVGNVTFVNSAVSHIMGKSAEELVGHAVLEVFPKELALRFTKSIREVFETGKRATVDAATLVRGHNVEISALLNPVKDATGAVVSVVGMARDVTTLKKAENLVCIIQDKFSEISRTKAGLFSAMAHYMKMSTNKAIGAVTLFREMKDNDVFSENQKSAFAAVERNTRNLEEIADLMLKFTLHNPSKPLSELPRVDMREVLESTIELLGRKIYAKNQNVEIVESTPESSLVTIDEEMIKQVVLNLLSNAIHYSPDNAVITATLTPKDSNLVVSIKDSGVGIPQAEHSKIFERFFRGSNFKSVEADVTGLGLAFSKALVEIWGGTIWFESEENKGTTFHFTIPTGGGRD